MPEIPFRAGPYRRPRGVLLLVLGLLLFLVLVPSLHPEISATPRPSPPGVTGRWLNLDQAPPVPALFFRLLTIVFLTIILSGLVINLQGLLKGRLRVFSPGFPPRVPWGVGAVVKLAVGFLILFFGLNLILGSLLGLFGVDPGESRPWLLLVNSIIQFGLLLGLSLIFLGRFRVSRPDAAFSENGPPQPRETIPAGMLVPERGAGEWFGRAREALRGYICFSPLLVLLIFLAWGLARIFGLPGHTHPLVGPLLEEGRPVLIWPLLLVGVILAPLAEEVFFRGLLFPALAKPVGVFWSAAITAALFAALHFNWVGLIPIFGLGVFLARAYHRTGSILVPIFIHGLHNALILAFTILYYRLI